MTTNVFHFKSLFAAFAVVAIMLSVPSPAWSQLKTAKGPYKVGNGVTPPKVLHKVDPEYTQEDKAAKIEGPVLLQIVVNAEGKAEGIKVVRGVSAGLDERAIEAIQKWVFQPGTKDGAAVDVYATVEVNFRLK